MREQVCKIYKRCNGCQLQNMTYDQQLDFKQRKVKWLYEKYIKVNPILGMEAPYHYRNKCQFSFRIDRNKNVVFGIYQSKTQSVTPVTSCLLVNPKATKIALSLCKLIKSFKLSVYDYYRASGLLRHVLIRTSDTTGELMVVLVVNSPMFPAKKKFVAALLALHPEISTVVLNISDNAKMMMGQREEILFGKGYITDKLMGKEFVISPASFYQINAVQTEVLYTKALQMAKFDGTETLLDAYCGTGTIGLIAAEQVSKVIGVEVSRDAIKDAKVNAKRNQVTNATFYCNDATKFMIDMVAKGEVADVVILDPPRAGSTRQCLSAILKLQPKKIIYISCCIETQERDIQQLLKGGYCIKEVQGVDLFPMTNHVENIALLTQNSTMQK